MFPHLGRAPDPVFWRRTVDNTPAFLVISSNTYRSLYIWFALLAITRCSMLVQEVSKDFPHFSDYAFSLWRRICHGRPRLRIQRRHSFHNGPESERFPPPNNGREMVGRIILECPNRWFTRCQESIYRLSKGIDIDRWFGLDFNTLLVQLDELWGGKRLLQGSARLCTGGIRSRSMMQPRHSEVAEQNARLLVLRAARL